VGRVGKQGANFVLVGENKIEAGVELREEPVAGSTHDFERREIEAERAAGRAGGAKNCVGQSAVEDDITFDVRVPAPGEIFDADFIRRKGHDRSQAGPHCALGVGRRENEAARVGLIALFETIEADAGVGEARPVEPGQFVAAEFADKGGAQAEPGGVERGIGGGAAGRQDRWSRQLGDQLGDLFRLDHDHAALFAPGEGKKTFGHGGDDVHDGSTDTDEIEGRLGRHGCGVKIVG